MPRAMEVRLWRVCWTVAPEEWPPHRSGQAALGASLSMLYEAPGGCGSAAYWALGGVWSQAARVPPSTVSSVPLTKDASSEARKATAFATSSGRPTRPRGVMATKADRSSPSPAWTPSVSMMPGTTALTRTPEGPYSLAQVLVSWSSAALLEPYAAAPGRPLRAAIVDRLMIDP